MRLSAGLAALLALGAAGPAQSEVRSLRTGVADLEQSSVNLRVAFRPQQQDIYKLAEHRLVDAQVLYGLKDYTRAAIVLLDYVNKYKNTRGYPEALFFLADSLYKRRDFLSARRYFREIVTTVRGPYYQDALQRLVELSLRTGDTSDVKQYLDALANIPVSQVKPSVPYVRGKYYFFRGQTDEAMRAFSSIMRGQQYYTQAQYFLGVCQVRNKAYDQAMRSFTELMRDEAKTEAEKNIRELTHLAIGRLLYEQNKIAEAIQAYQRVEHDSEAFDVALYEIAWAYVKAREHDKALRALDLLVLAQPDSPFVPDVTVLQGNLLIRLEDWGRATELFSNTRDEFSKVHERMSQLMAEYSDPNVYFDALLAREMEAGLLAMSVEVPEVALHWVKQKPRVKRALHLVGDVRDIEKSLKESRHLIARLQAAIHSPARVKIFPDYAIARTNALEMENRLAQLRKRILEGERKLIEPVLTAEERTQLLQIRREQGNLDRSVAQLPPDTASFKQRTASQLERIAELDKELSRLSLLVQDLKAQLAAAEKYFTDTQSARDTAKRQSFEKQSEEMRATVKVLEDEVDELNGALADAKNAAGVGGPEEVAERGVKERYRVVSDKEHEFLIAFRARLTDQGQRTELDELAQLMGRCDGVDTTLRLFNARLYQGVDEKLADVRAVLAEEQQAIDGYATLVASQRTDTDQVAGALIHEGFQQVSQRFYDIVVRADVGIIDVAWALKDSKTKEVSGLVRQQKMDLKLLDDEFSEVLGTTAAK